MSQITTFRISKLIYIPMCLFGIYLIIGAIMLVFPYAFALASDSWKYVLENYISKYPETIKNHIIANLYLLHSVILNLELIPMGIVLILSNNNKYQRHITKWSLLLIIHTLLQYIITSIIEYSDTTVFPLRPIICFIMVFFYGIYCNKQNRPQD